MNSSLLQSWIECGGKLSFQDIFAQFAETDPRWAFASRYLAQERNHQSEQDEAGVDGAASISRENASESPNTIEVELREAKARLREARRIERMLTRMNTELQELRARNDTLADALGACSLCWGEEPECKECGGCGTPGATTPDPELFHHFIVPAVRRAERFKTRSQDPQPDYTTKRKTGIQP